VSPRKQQQQQQHEVVVPTKSSFDYDDDDAWMNASTVSHNHVNATSLSLSQRRREVTANLKKHEWDDLSTEDSENDEYAPDDDWDNDEWEESDAMKKGTVCCNRCGDISQYIQHSGQTYHT
jgi:hypothetical protein